jgi:hypothetical protein
MNFPSDMKFLIRSIPIGLLLTGLTGSLRAQSLANLGAGAPAPGTNDIYQLSTQGNQVSPDGLNYFTDNQTGHGTGEPGQTFTTGTNVTGYLLTSVALRTGGIGTSNGTTSAQPYYLRIYSITGSTTTLLQTYTSGNLAFNDGDWLKWTGISVHLAANATYAYSFGKASSTAGWEPMAVATNQYAGGEIALISPANGTVATGSSHKFDAVFVLGLETGATNSPNIPDSMPLPLPTYGFNLGNSLEAVWGFTYPTAAPLYTAANAGFNAVRIPVAWADNAITNISGGVTNYPINPVFMAKVKQTVDNAIAAGLYVVMNDHWDDGWLENNIGTNVDATINAKMKDYWTQIATIFAGYDNHLLFAAANEPNISSPQNMITLMYYYQTFVNAVRAAGGNNTNRWLVIQSVSDPTWLNALPTDTVSNRIMVEYHNYTPSLFTIIHSDQSWGNAIYFWGPAYHYSGDASRNATWGEESDIDSFHQQLADLYVSKGIPVMIGEFGAYPTSSLTGTEATWNRDATLYWDKYVAESARAHGLSPFYWSTPGSPIDFTSGAVNDTQVVSVLTGGAAPPPPNGAPYAPSGLTATGGNGQVVLSWMAGSGASSYNLYRATQSGGESSIAPVVTGITGTTYTNASLNSGATYYYQVVAVNGSGSSGFSPEAQATTSGATDTTQFNFESGSQGWNGGGGIVSGVTTSTAQHFAGNQSLAVNFTGASAGTASPSVGNVAIAAGTTITFHVWIPSGSKITALQPFTQDQNNPWNGSWHGSFTANAWNTLTLTVPTNAATPLSALGIQLFTSAGWTGTCYIDAVSYESSAPDFDLAANPASLTVAGGTNGASTITVAPINGLNACYTLSVSNLPSGVSAIFTNNPNTGGQSLLTLTADNTVVSGTTNVTVIATAGLISHTQTISLTLNNAAPRNTTPALDPIANQTVNVGQTVAFTASATDTDLPPQTLTFALLTGATNVTLNPNSGAFSFRPLTTQANSTNDFTLAVSDNGSPSLSATQSFVVVVNSLSVPTISNVSVAGGQFSLSINGQGGPDYAIETSTNLTQWNIAFITNSPAMPFVWADTNFAAPQQFYRIKLGPPLP